MSSGGNYSDKRMELGRCQSVRGEVKVAGYSVEGDGSGWR